MLPFLKPKDKAGAGLIVMDRNQSPEAPQEQQPEEDQGLSSAACDMIAAIHAKDDAALVAALQAFIEMNSAAPTDEESAMPPMEGMPPQ